MRFDAEYGFLLKLRLVRRDNFEDRLFIACVVRVDKVQDARSLLNDYAIRAAPLP